MRPLCVIPARRGSKRLPLKNLLLLHGRPMLAYSVEAALESRLFDRVYVSSEDEEILTVAQRAGATPHHRPEALAGDLVSATDVCLELEQVLASRGEVFDAIVCLQPSSPLRSVEDIRGSWDRFMASGADYLVSVTPIDPHDFHWAVHETPDGWAMYFGTQFLKERPLLPPVFRPNGSIKIGKTNSLRATRNFFGNPLTVYVTPEARSLHVATECDFRIAECLLASIRQPCR